MIKNAMDALALSLVEKAQEAHLERSFAAALAERKRDAEETMAKAMVLRVHKERVLTRSVADEMAVGMSVLMGRKYIADVSRLAEGLVDFVLEAQ